MYGKSKQVQILEEKGINFPDTVVSLPALSTEDKEVLPEVAQFADLINVSFVQSEKDIEEVQALLKEC
jgi:pyruvate kinase